MAVPPLACSSCITFDAALPLCLSCGQDKSISVQPRLEGHMMRAEFLHVKPGKGAAFVRTKLKNYITGNVVDKTFRAGESAIQAVLEKRDCQFSYPDGDEVKMLYVSNCCETCWALAVR